MRQRFSKMLMLASLAWPLLSLAQPAAAPEQSTKPMRPARDRIEFPLRLKHKVVAGKTAVGTPVEGELVIPTLVKGVVIPTSAVFTGTVEESVAHTDVMPSRLKIRITTAKWNDNSLAVNLYATGFVYPLYSPKLTPQQRSQQQTLLHFGQYEATESRYPSTPVFDTRRLLSSDVSNERSNNGMIAVVSKKSTIHLSGGSVICFEGSAVK